MLRQVFLKAPKPCYLLCFSNISEKIGFQVWVRPLDGFGGDFGESFGRLFGDFGRPFGAMGEVIGRLWGPFGWLLGAFGGLWDAFGMRWTALGTLWVASGSFQVVCVLGIARNP